MGDDAGRCTVLFLPPDGVIRPQGIPPTPRQMMADIDPPPTGCWPIFARLADSAA